MESRGIRTRNLPQKPNCWSFTDSWCYEEHHDWVLIWTRCTDVRRLKTATTEKNEKIIMWEKMNLSVDNWQFGAPGGKQTSTRKTSSRTRENFWKKRTCKVFQYIFTCARFSVFTKFLFVFVFFYYWYWLILWRTSRLSADQNQMFWCQKFKSNNC